MLFQTEITETSGIPIQIHEEMERLKKVTLLQEKANAIIIKRRFWFTRSTTEI